jgi:moderate conductance mechanosensitive channel
MPDFTTPPWTEIGKFASGTAVPIVIIAIFAIVFVGVAERFLGRLIRRLIRREAGEGTAAELTAVEIERRIDTVSSLATSVIRVLVATIAVIMILGKFSVDIGPAVAGLGIVGIAVGFGAQSLVKDYFNGVLILVENQFARGDVVRIAGVSGSVEDFTLRRTTLRDADGTVHSVPNGEIGVASNLTRLWASVNENVSVAYGTDIDRATKAVDDVGQAMAADPVWADRILEAPHVVRVEALGEYGVTLKVLGTVRAEARWDAPGELRKRLLAAFAELGIEIPRPQRVVLSSDPFAASDPSSAAVAAPESGLGGDGEVGVAGPGAAGLGVAALGAPALGAPAPGADTDVRADAGLGADPQDDPGQR